MFENIMVVIPSLNPDEKLKATVAGIKAAGFNNILVVNDGSSKENLQNFPSADEVTLLTHRVNKGKGAALKTAFRYINLNMPSITGVITADGDGQHTPEDIAKCAEALDTEKREIILGCRDFSGPDVPPRSRFGNRTTSLVFRLLCGMKISDTQTGLRGFPRKLFGLLCSIEGDRFEYETNMLLKFKQNGVAIKEVKIQTVYIEENRTSHFHTIRDSIRVYRFILAFVLSSAISFVADISIFYLIAKLAGALLGGATELVATVGARVISSFINFSINRNKVFTSKAALLPSLLKYYALAVPQMLASAIAVSFFSWLFAANAEGATAIKLIVDTILFFISYRIQQNWVFADKKAADVTTESAADNGEPINTENAEKPKLTTGKIIRRSLLCVGTAILLAVVTAVSACLVIVHGPSPALRDMLVISAKQASATKWLPGLFLSEEVVNDIMKKSENVNTDTVTVDDLKTEEAGEWDDAIDGMKLIFERKPNFKAYVILLKDPSRISVGVSSENFKTATVGMRMFEMAEKYNAVAAINGGEFWDVGGRATGAQPMGLTYSGGKLVWNDSAKKTFIGFDKNNKLVVSEGMTSTEANALGIRDAVSFQNGNVIIKQSGEKVELYYSDKNTGTAQRTAIGQRADGTVIMIVTDGRTADSIGATRNDIIEMMVQYGAVNAGMLDGGSSAMMYYRDYATKYGIDASEFDQYQQLGLVNRYKAFTKPRKIPTYFVVTGE